MKLLKVLVTSSVLLLGVSEAKVNASFDCSKASSVIEKLICSDKKLANEDIDMLDTYRDVKKGLSKEEVRKLLKSQRVWLKSRKKICSIPKKYQSEGNEEVIECLIKEYQKRVKEIKNFSQTTIVTSDKEKEIEVKKPISKIEDTIDKDLEKKSIKKEDKNVKFEGYFSVFDSVTMPSGEEKYLESYLKIDKKDETKYEVSALIYTQNGNSCEIKNLTMTKENSKLLYSKDKCKFSIKKEKNELILEDENYECSLSSFECGLNSNVHMVKFTIY